MSRTLSTGMANHLISRAHTRCKMLRLDLSDGTSLGFTDHDRALAFDLGDGSISYSPETGILPSALQLRVGFDVDNYEISGPIGDVVTIVAVLGGRFNRARARYFEVNWSDLSLGAIKLMEGNVSEARVEGGKFIFQIRSVIDRYNQMIGRLITPYCNADFGDARCGYTVSNVAATVSAVTDGMRFSVTFSGSYADDYFNLGTVTFTSGALSGTSPVEVFDWTAAGAVTTFVPLEIAPEVGDTLNLVMGCPKTRDACRDLFSNIDNFRGFPEVPGSDQVLRAQIPSA